MPIFLDRHDVVEFSAAEVAKLHVKDLQVQDKYGVRFLTYRYDAERRTTFCLVDAPDKETADKVHAKAHGHVANEMIAVDLSAVEAFLGRIQDPPSAKTMPIDDSAFRAIMFTDMVGSTEMTAQLGDTMAVDQNPQHIERTWHQTIQPNKDQAIHGTEGQSLRQMPALDVKLMTKDQDLSFQRDPRPEQ